MTISTCGMLKTALRRAGPSYAVLCVPGLQERRLDEIGQFVLKGTAQGCCRRLQTHTRAGLGSPSQWHSCISLSARPQPWLRVSWWCRWSGCLASDYPSTRRRRCSCRSGSPSASCGTSLCRAPTSSTRPRQVGIVPLRQSAQSDKYAQSSLHHYVCTFANGYHCPMQVGP